MDEYEARKAGGKKALSKARGKTGATIRTGPLDSADETLTFEFCEYDEESGKHWVVPGVEDEFGLVSSQAILLNTHDHWKLPDLVRAKSKVSLEDYSRGAPVDTISLVYETSALKGGHTDVERTTAFIKNGHTEV
eukprot:TRINITY_DN2470_c0_g1_i1.p1 TRINITY_DN2470_c0_g1~~TRINITY_DN2470_c0_g1_i1.p1  ORF type:complete len:135 (+),score=19.77 TRINITY_DN2470_c0_g1_i1:25-429(+)